MRRVQSYKQSYKVTTLQIKVRTRMILSERCLKKCKADLVVMLARAKVVDIITFEMHGTLGQEGDIYRYLVERVRY